MEHINKPTKKVFAFNSIPGISIGTSLNAFRDYLDQEFSVSSKVVSIDEKLKEAFPRDTSVPIIDETDDFWFRLLSRQPKEIKQIWEKASEEALAEVEGAKEEFVFVFFHNSFFSYDYKWRVSGVDIDQLKKFNFLAFFNFIDDIYDIHFRRKRDRRTILKRVIKESKDETQKFLNFIEFTVDKLVEYIEWRQSEILLTDIFALHLKIPSFIFSIKHPKRTLWKLIKNIEASAYLSHPISEVRRNLKIKSSTHFYDYDKFENNQLYQQITGIAEHARAKFPLIEPTTIDELRIKEIKDKRNRRGDKWLRTPLLSARWSPITHLDSLVPELPEDRQNHDSVIIQHDIESLGLSAFWERFTAHKLNANIYLQTHYLMSLLERKIKQDIAWRDHHLVEQTNNLLVIRPSFLGKSSGGVRREVQYFINAARPNAKCLILHEKSDCQLCPEKSASQILENLKRLRDYRDNFQNTKDHSTVSKIENEITGLLKRYIDESTFTHQQLITEITKNIYNSFSRKSDTQSDLGILDNDPLQEDTEEQNRAFLKLHTEISKGILKGNFYAEILKKEGNQTIKFTDNQESFLNQIEESNFFEN